MIDLAQLRRRGGPSDLKGWSLVRGPEDDLNLVSHAVLMDYAVASKAMRLQGEQPLSFSEWLERGPSVVVHHDGPITFH